VRKRLRRLIKLILPTFIMEFRGRVLYARKYRAGNKRSDLQFANKSPKEVFTTIYRENLWGTCEGSDYYSGSGSHDETRLGVYVDAVSSFLSRFPSKPNVVDLGCGDFNVGKELRAFCGEYIAGDVVDLLVDRNKLVYNEMEVDFRSIDICEDELPIGEVAFVRQVLQHLNNEQIMKFVNKVQIYRYLIVSEGLPRKENFVANVDKPIGDGIRFKRSRKENSGVVLHLPPFNLSHISNSVLCEAMEGDAVIRTTVYQLQ